LAQNRDGRQRNSFACLAKTSLHQANAAMATFGNLEAEA
jgi:hypothetical protein